MLFCFGKSIQIHLKYEDFNAVGKIEDEIGQVQENEKCYELVINFCCVYTIN